MRKTLSLTPLEGSSKGSGTARLTRHKGQDNNREGVGEHEQDLMRNMRSRSLDQQLQRVRATENKRANKGHERSPLTKVNNSYSDETPTHGHVVGEDLQMGYGDMRPSQSGQHTSHDNTDRANQVHIDAYSVRRLRVFTHRSDLQSSPGSP